MLDDGVFSTKKKCISFAYVGTSMVSTFSLVPPKSSYSFSLVLTLKQWLTCVNKVDLFQVIMVYK